MDKIIHLLLSFPDASNNDYQIEKINDLLLSFPNPPPITKRTRNRSSEVKKQNKKPHRKKDKNNNPNHKSNYVWLLLERRQSFVTLLRSCWCSKLAVALVLFCRLPTTRGCLINVQTKGFKMKIARYLLHRYSKC
jgi:hypothetical protein